MPFGEYKDMEDCIAKNKDKNSPGGYCAAAHKKATGEWPAEKADQGVEPNMLENIKRLLTTGPKDMGTLNDETTGPLGLPIKKKENESECKDAKVSQIFADGCPQRMVIGGRYPNCESKPQEPYAETALGPLAGIAMGIGGELLGKKLMKD